MAAQPFIEQGRFTQGFGPSQYDSEPALFGYAHFHTGVDYAVPYGTPIIAPEPGQVTLAGMDNTGYGLRLQIRLDDGYSVLYGHLSHIDVREGDRVDAGDQVAESGNTGNSTGAHVHYTVIDPSNTLIDPATWAPSGVPSGASAGGVSTTARNVMLGLVAAFVIVELL